MTPALRVKLGLCSYLLYKVHTFGWLHAVSVVNYMWNVVFRAHGGQLLEPTGQRKWMEKQKTVVVTFEQMNTGGVIYLSGTRGAKQDVVEWTQRTFSGPSSSILRSTASRSVRNSSPSRTFSTTTGSKPDQQARISSKTIPTWKIDSCCHYSVTCCDHGFETGLLVNAGPNDVASLWPAMTEGQETQGQAHSRRHGHNKTAGHAADTYYPDEIQHRITLELQF